MARNIPVDKISAQICDAVSSEMWSRHPWRDTCQTIPFIPLQDSVQDYNSPPTFFKLVSGQIVKTAPDPQFVALDPLDVRENLPENYIPTAPEQIKYFSADRGLGLIRLQYPPAIQGLDAYELHGVYQLQHTRVVDTTSATWFKDQLWHVAQAGLLVHGYMLGDKSPAVIELQTKVFNAKLEQAWSEEEGGQADSLYPAEGSIGGWGNR